MNDLPAVVLDAPARPVPPRPPRDLRLDIVRGWLQLTIFASHATGSWIGVWLIHGRWGLSDSSEQFVFLSGFMLGSLFARNAARGGWWAATRDMLRRTWRLYVIQLGLFAIMGVLIALADASILPGEAVWTLWAPVFAHPLGLLPNILLMVEQPNFMGILPLFICCMLMLPGFAAVQARLGSAALLLSAGLYAACWAAVLAWPAALRAEYGIGFNPLTWQVLFLGGAFLGRRALWRGRALEPSPRWRRALTAAAVTILAAGLALRLSLPYADLPGWATDKKDLAAPVVLHALALAWLVQAYVPRERPWMHNRAAQVLAAIGRHSLLVFCLGVVLSWLATVAYRLIPPWPLLDPLVIGLGCALLALYGLWLERRRYAAVSAQPAPA